MAAKRIRPNPSRFGNFGLMAPRNPLIQINPQQFVAENVAEKKFHALGGHGLPGLDPDVSRQNALSNLSQALQVELHNQTRNIIRLNNTSSKSSTPHTETPTPKSVIQPSEQAKDQSALEEMEETHGASDLSRRNSVVQENNTVLNNNTDSTNDQDKEPLEGATNNNSENKVNGFQSEAEINPDQVVDEHVAGRPLPNDDDLNLEEVMKQRTNSISSLVAAHDAAIAHAAIQSHSALQASHHHQQQGQGQHHGVQVQPQSQQQQEQPQQANSTITVTHGAHEPHRSQADVLKDNLANMKEEMDSDCELVENEDTVSHH